MNKLVKLILLSILVIGLIAACGGDDATPEPAAGNDDTASETSSDSNDSSSETSSSDNNDSAAESADSLSLGEGQFYIIQSTGAISDTYTGTSWGNIRSRQLYDAGDYWTLVIGSTNRADAVEVSTIQLNILKGIEPGTYTITEGGLLTDPEPDTPVTLMNVNLRYPDFQILNDEEEFDGTLTITAISDEGMAGTVALSLMGEGGDVRVVAVFDVPVVEPIE